MAGTCNCRTAPRTGGGRGLPAVDIARYLVRRRTDRCELTLERLAIEITSKRQALEDARIAQKQAETAASEKRAHWAKRSAATHKWRQIETDVWRAADTHSEATAELEADDEVLLRYGSGLLTAVAESSI